MEVERPFRAYSDLEDEHGGARAVAAEATVRSADRSECGAIGTAGSAASRSTG